MSCLPAQSRPAPAIQADAFQFRTAYNPADGRMGRHSGRSSERSDPPTMGALRPQRRGADLGRGKLSRYATKDVRIQISCSSTNIHGPTSRVFARRCSARLPPVSSSDSTHSLGTLQPSELKTTRTTHSLSSSNPGSSSGPSGGLSLLTDGDVRGIIEDFHRAARMAGKSDSTSWTSSTVTDISDMNSLARIHVQAITAEALKTGHDFFEKLRRHSSCSSST
jgi:hypothetical protein